MTQEGARKPVPLFRCLNCMVIWQGGGLLGIIGVSGRKNCPADPAGVGRRL